MLPSGGEMYYLRFLM